MAEDFDVEAMLEAPYRKEEDLNSSRHNSEHERVSSHKSSKKSSDRKRSRSRDRGRDRSRDRDRRSRSRERSRRSDRDRRSRSRDRSRRDDHDRHRERRRSRDRERSRRSRSRDRRRERSRSSDRSRTKDDRPRRRSITKSPVREKVEMTPEERDARTVFCMQLSAKIRPRDIEEFFSSVGKVMDVRIITDNKTRRSKGIAYVEFKDVTSVPLAIGLNGQRLLGVPIMVQVSQAEKNRAAMAASIIPRGGTGPMRLYVGSLHFNITEEMLRGIFEPFGKIVEIKLLRNHETSRSQGYGFVTYHTADDAKKALDQLNGFELAGRPMKVGHVTERLAEMQAAGYMDTDEMDRAGVDLGATGRLQLMAKLAEGTGFEIPSVAANALSLSAANAAQAAQVQPPIATQCFILSNMFDPNNESGPTWDVEIKDDVIEECNKHGGVLHIYVDKASPQGNVYVKCPTISAAVASVQALHGRWFAGKVITAAYVPLPNYHSLFAEAATARNIVLSTNSHISSSHGFSSVPPTAQFS